MNPRRRFTLPLASGATLALGDRPFVMGVINVTPDSFSDGGRLFDPAQAIEAGVRMVEEGADLLDVGGESTRPGAQPIDETEEQRRVVPVVKGLSARVRVPVSVDTYRPSTADAALTAGAAIVNDISGLQFEPALAEVVVRHRAPIILMHTRGHPAEMSEHAVYQDVVAEVLDELRASVAFALSAGVPENAVIVDPGVGFAKTAAQSCEVLARLGSFAELGRPILVGPSRKSFLTRAIGAGVPAAERDWATAAAVTAAVLGGAHIVRVHAVREMVHVVRVADEIRRYDASVP